MKRTFFLTVLFLFVLIAAVLLWQNEPATAQEDRDAPTGEALQSNAPQACVTDGFEPNNSCGAATSLIPGFYSSLYVCTGDEDWFSVDVPAGHRLEVNSYFTQFSGDNDLELRLYDDTCGNLLATSSSVSDNESITYQTTNAASLKVLSFGWDAADEGAYELEIKTSCNDCFTYQGQLQDGGGPTSGDYEFQFQLFDAVADGTAVAGPITRTVGVANGQFTTQLYFGDPATFSGYYPLFLQIGVRPAGSAAAFADLSPRQELTAAPVAHSLVAGAVVSGSVPGRATLSVQNSSPGNPGLLVGDTNGNGIQIADSGAYGIFLENPGFSGLYVSGAGGDGLYITSPGDDGVQVFNPNDEGVYVSGAGGTGVYVSSADQHGVYGRTVDAGYYGGYFFNGASTSSGDGAGLYAAGNTTAAADIVLGGGRGRITALNGSGADMYLDSNDNVIVRLDRDGNAPGTYGSFFGVVDSSGSYPFYVYETGTAYFAGNVSKGGGSFMIDHPLDPENKLLYHSFVESPDMMNIYNGNAELGADGSAWVELPEWFGALNRDYRYQLTPIGAPGPNLYIAQPVTDNRFQIAGGEAGMTVSWQVTGIRQDPYAEAHRIPVEVEKPADQQGTYLHPGAWGQPAEQQFDPQSLEATGPEPASEALEGADLPFEAPDEAQDEAPARPER